MSNRDAPKPKVTYEHIGELIYSQPTDALVRTELEAFSMGRLDLVEFIGEILRHEGRIEDWYGGPVLPQLERLAVS